MANKMVMHFQPLTLCLERQQTVSMRPCFPPPAVRKVCGPVSRTYPACAAWRAAPVMKAEAWAEGSGVTPTAGLRPGQWCLQAAHWGAGAPSCSCLEHLGLMFGVQRSHFPCRSICFPDTNPSPSCSPACPPPSCLAPEVHLCLAWGSSTWLPIH